MKTLILLLSVLFTTMSFAQVPSYLPTSGLVGWWPFNGNANDESGNGNNGTVNGAALTIDRYGNINNAYFLNHTDEILTNYNGLSGSQPRTISFWMKNQNSSKTINPIWYGGDPNQPITGSAFNIIFNRNEQNDPCNCWPTTYEGIGISADWIYTLRSTIIGDNQWHHWLVSLENAGDNFNQVKYYKDGVLISASIIFDYNNNGSTIVNTSNISPLKFGKSSGLSNNPDRAATEYLDDIGVWNRALTQQEITNLYTSTVPVSCLPAYVPTSGLVGYWPFCGNANDESGNGNNGTVNGANLTTDRYGISNSCFDFNGVNQNIDVTNSNSLNPNEITISVWIFPLSDDICIISKNDPTNATAKSFRLSHQDFWQNQHGLSTRYGTGNCNSQNENGFYGNQGSVTNNVWSHIITTVSASGLVKHYLNGTLLETSQSVPMGSCDNSLSSMRIGGLYWNGEPNWFLGKIDDIGIWNRVLTPQEITNLYTSTVSPTVAILSGDATICAGSSTNLSVAVTGGTAPYSVTVTDGTNNYTATGASPVSIPVSPTATSTYTIVSVSGGGTGTGNTGTATVTVTAVPTQPTLACYETAVFNTTSCSWDVTGTQPIQPTVACYETATFNTTTCAWVVSGTQPESTIACYQAAVFNTTTCLWEIVEEDVQEAQPTVACYQTATFNTISCTWVVTGTQPTQPTGLACFETATFNNTTCVWDVTGTQPAQPTGLACYQTAAFNTTTCSWDVTGTQPVQPTLACYETATFNTTTCSWVISGPQAPQKMSYQAVIRNSNDSLLISTPVGMRISLVQGAPSGTVVFSETQTATTNANGLVSLQIGMGTAVSGTFACIDWAAGPYYVKTETDLTGGANYTIISSNELMSVPYALFSANGPTGALPPGTVAGEMNYWNGTAWVTVAPGLSLPGNQALTLSLCNGVPTWGPCPAVLPTVTTTAVLNITNFSASSGRMVTSDGGATLSAWGVCWSTSTNPTIANNFVQNNGGLSGLTPNTTYYVRAYATNSAGTAYGNEQIFTTTNTSDVIEGLSFQGGIVAYILQPGDPGYAANIQHGLIAAPSDQGTAPWGCGFGGAGSGTLIPGANGTAIGSGSQNTIDIMTGCSTAVTAAHLCGDLVLNGYSDWYLPSKDELNKLYVNRVAIGGFASWIYWSSTQIYEGDAWRQYFDNNGYQGHSSSGMNNNDVNVRAVRAF